MFELVPVCSLEPVWIGDVKVESESSCFLQLSDAFLKPEDSFDVDCTFEVSLTNSWLVSYWWWSAVLERVAQCDRFEHAEEPYQHTLPLKPGSE